MQSIKEDEESHLTLQVPSLFAQSLLSLPKCLSVDDKIFLEAYKRLHKNSLFAYSAGDAALWMLSSLLKYSTT